MCGFSPAEFPTPKKELVQKFQVLYLGMLPVARPIGITIIIIERIIIKCKEHGCIMLMLMVYLQV